MSLLRIGSNTLARLGVGLTVALVLASVLNVRPVAAKVSPEEAAQLGMPGESTLLTPFGAIRAGTEDGRIPTWTGGLTDPPARKDGWYVDPFADDQPLFTITAQNYKQYEDILTEGHIALFGQYPETYKMNVYPTRRSASFPQRLYEGSIFNASHTEFCKGGDGPDGINARCLEDDWDHFRPGVAFPIPKSGAEAMWNHTNYYTGDQFVAKVHGFNVTEGGQPSRNMRTEWTIYPYYWEQGRWPTHPYMAPGKEGRAMWCLGYNEQYPPQSAGRVVGGCNRTKNTDFDAYLYLPGQRRVRKAPEIGFYDTPGSGSDGIRTSDQRFLWAMTGTTERYDYDQPTRVVKLAPNNNYKLAQPGLKIEDIVRAGHPNQDLIRYEILRVWRIEGRVKPGERHLSPHRLVYMDEDSWAGTTGVMWDEKDQLWRVSESFNMNFYDVPMVTFWGDAHMDLAARRWTTTQAYFQMDPEGRGTPPDFKTARDPSVFTPAGLRAQGTR